MSQHPKKVALVYDAIFPYLKGGGEKRFHDIGKQLAKDGYDVHLYGMKFWDGPDTIQRFGMTLHGLCKARPLYTKSGRRALLQPVIFGLSCIKLLREDFDVIDCCGFPYFSIFMCRLVAAVKRKRLHATWYEVWGKAYWRSYLGHLGRIGYMVEWLAVRMPHVVIPISQHTAEALKTLGRRGPIHIIENGIYVDEIERIAGAPLHSDIIYAGRLVEFKHVDILLHAVALLAKAQPDVTCIIIGDGPERSRLEQMTDELGLRHSVRFLGFLEGHNDVVAAMKSSRVFVLPSSREGFGIVVTEANAAGIPVVTVNEKANAANALIDGTNGVVVDLTPQALANAIHLALTHFTTEQCLVAARRYDWANVAHKIEAILQ